MDERSESRLKWVALIVGMVLAFPLGVVMVGEAPYVLVALATMAFLGWIGVRSGLLDADADEPAEADPLSTLQERYAAGELSEAEFERRLDRILESDQRAERTGGLEATAGERERVTERE